MMRHQVEHLHWRLTHDVQAIREMAHKARDQAPDKVKVMTKVAIHWTAVSTLRRTHTQIMHTQLRRAVQTWAYTALFLTQHHKLTVSSRLAADARHEIAKARGATEKAEAEKAQVLRDSHTASQRYLALQMELDLLKESTQQQKITLKAQLHVRSGSMLVALMVFSRQQDRRMRKLLSNWWVSRQQALVSGQELSTQMTISAYEEQIESTEGHLLFSRDQNQALKDENEELRRNIIDADRRWRQATTDLEVERRTNSKLTRRVENLEGQLRPPNLDTTPSLGGIIMPRWKLKPADVRRKKSSLDSSDDYPGPGSGLGEMLEQAAS